jgi:hypothetical protein
MNEYRDLALLVEEFMSEMGITHDDTVFVLIDALNRRTEDEE